jgi:mono/diheme cytochrome c family protein
MRRTAAAIGLGLAWLTCLGTASRAVSGGPAVPLPVSAGRAPAAPAEATQPTTSIAPSAFLDTYCVTCHNDRVRAAGLSFNPAALGDPAANPELWEKVLQKVRTGQMPPVGRPRPDAATLAAVLGTVADSLDRAAAAHPDPGRVGVHRLNRTEYRNAILDLLSLQVDAAALLLPDEADEGFDNVAASLALSPSHLERYLAAARAISRQAVGDRTLGEVPASITYRVPKLLEQDVRLGDDLPFGSRGGFAVVHDFPLDGEYAFKVRLRRQVYDYIVGMGQAQELDLRIDGVRVKRFTVGGEATGTPGPLTWNGEIVGDTPWELYMHAADAHLEVRTAVAAGPHTVTASFVASPRELEGIAQPLQVDFGRGSDEQYDGDAAVDALTVHGPYGATGTGDTPSRRTIFTCRPPADAEDRGCARQILSTLGRRAYRRPITGAELDTLLAFYDQGRAQGGFEGGIQAAIERLLVSFNFLFRIERTPAGTAPGAVYRLSDLELASRLSFFLWNSIPDDTLLDVAAQGKLRAPAELSRQVTRILRDPRSRSLVDSFASQWLGLRKAQTWLPDPNIFPEFDENLRRAFIQETTTFVGDQVRDDRSIIDLVSADYSFVNERLAEHYGLSGIVGQRLRKVTFSDGVRGGLLGQGGLLMVTSYPDRTAPVVRGFWVLENLLGMPPPPPPPNVPDLQSTTENGRPLSMRAQMETHRRNPACSVCHVRMDPLGFAMENLDAIGRWRTRSGGVAVDAAAVFADGTPIDGLPGLRRFILQHRDDYVHTVASKLLTYALGRHVDYRDQPALRRIIRDAAAGGDRWSALILGIVNSTPFQMGKAAS